LTSQAKITDTTDKISRRAEFLFKKQRHKTVIRNAFFFLLTQQNFLTEARKFLHGKKF